MFVRNSFNELFTQANLLLITNDVGYITLAEVPTTQVDGITIDYNVANELEVIGLPPNNFADKCFAMAMAIAL